MSVELKKNPFFLSDQEVEWVHATLASMTEEEKIAQLFCLITYTDDEQYLAHLAKDLKVGGVMTRTMSLAEMINTVTGLQKYAKIPMLISANLEAGLNQACTTGTRVGCEMGIAATGDVKYAHELGRVIGEEASALGINWAFAPIIDIDFNFRNPITNTRTFGSDPDVVANFGKAYVEEVQKYGIAASIKHFPGDGVDERDQHLVASVNSLSAEDWEKTYGKAYKTSIDAGAKTVMVGHILQPAWSKKLNSSLKDEEIMPGLIAPELLQGLLRGRLGFNGLIVTDSSTMAGMGTMMPREKAVPCTIASGCDMFLFTKNLEEDMQFMTQGVRDGVITQERLNEAVTRILALKASLHLPEKQKNGGLFPDRAAAEKIVGCAEHRRVSKEVAERSITLVKEEKGVLPITPQRYKRILVYKKEGKASAVSADFSALEDVPEALKTFTLTFRTDNEILKQVSFSYGDSFDEEAYPALPQREGYYARWSLESLEDLRFDTVVEAIYTPYITVLCAAPQRENGRAVFYIEGDYQEKDRLEAEPFGAQDALPEDMEPPAFRRQALTERWKLSIPDNGEQTHTLRYLPPEESGRLWLYLHTEAGWSQVQAREIGRYLVFPVTGNDIELAVCTVYLAPWVWALAAALSVFLLAMAVPRLRRRCKKESRERMAPPSC